MIACQAKPGGPAAKRPVRRLARLLLAHPDRLRDGDTELLGAAVAFKQLLTEDLRVLGPDHPNILTTRGTLAY